jgi:hypothetical protein
MNHNAKELIIQILQSPTMNCGHHMMEDTVKTNVSWDNKYHMLEGSKNLSALMEKSMRQGFLDNTVPALSLTTNVMLDISDLTLDNVLSIQRLRKLVQD